MAEQESGYIPVEKHRDAARTEALGPGTAGLTISGAAYRGKETADNMGVAGPEERGFGDTTGLNYADVERESDYDRAQRTPHQRPR